MQRLYALIGTLFLLIAAPAIAKEPIAGPWIVSQQVGVTQVFRSGLQPASVKVQSKLSAGDIVVTGANGRLMLTRGGDYVVVAPNSRLMLPKEQQATGFTRLIQQMGTMLYKVRHTGVPHFSVDAPMLAAVVKGTSFTVIVDQNRTAVQVTEGVVEVTAAAGGMSTLVEKGATVFVGRDNPQAIIEATEETIETNGSQGSDSIRVSGTQQVSLATIADLTGGLITAVSEIPASTGLLGNLTTTNALVQTSAVTTGSIGSATTTAVTGLVDTTAGQLVSATVNVGLGAVPLATETVTGVATVVPVVAVPTNTPVITIPAITTPVITTPAITTPVITTPVITTPVVTTPVITTPVMTTPVITTPVVTTPVITTPAITIPDPGI